MIQNESAKFLIRLVQERHDEVKTALNELFQKLVSENKAEKVKSAQNLYDKSNTLLSILSSDDRPNWLLDLVNRTQWFIKNQNSGNACNTLLQTLIHYQEFINSHEWAFLDGTDSLSYNFDEIYERFKSESRLSELFDIMITTLEKMIESDGIDSLKTLDSLRRLLSMLRQNKSGSYFSLMASWEFLRGFIRNTIWESLDDIPVVKQLKKGFEKTLLEMDVELEEVHSSIAEEMKSKFDTGVHSLTYKREGIKKIKAEDESD